MFGNLKFFHSLKIPFVGTPMIEIILALVNFLNHLIRNTLFRQMSGIEKNDIERHHICSFQKAIIYCNFSNTFQHRTSISFLYTNRPLIRTRWRMKRAIIFKGFNIIKQIFNKFV